MKLLPPLSDLSSYILGYFNDRDPEIEYRIASGIETHRKGFAELQVIDELGAPASDVKLAIEQTAHDFFFGGNLFMLGAYSSAEQNQRYEDYFTRVFNSAVVPYYWDGLEPEENRPRLHRDSKPVKRRPAPEIVLDFCDKHRIIPKGHPLVYYQFQPEWVPQSQHKRAVALHRRIDQIASAHGLRVPMWDVVNEALDQTVETVMPRDYVFASLEKAKAVFPHSSHLFLNEATRRVWEDFHHENSAFYLLAQSMLLRGAKLDGLGFQYHHFFFDENGMSTRPEELARQRDVLLDPRRLLELLDCYSRLGLPLHISEITLPTYSQLPDGERFQAQLLRELYRLWFSHPSVEGIYWWNVPDGGAHGNEGKLRAGLLNEQLLPKPSYDELHRLVREEWWTRLTTTASRVHPFKGFYGTYRITAEFNGHRSVHTIELHRDGMKKFRLNVSRGTNG